VAGGALQYDFLRAVHPGTLVGLSPAGLVPHFIRLRSGSSVTISG
jgi:hypothetical protein